jgi:hypothetical protein
MIRRYGNSIVNLTKVISVSGTRSSINFIYPVTNHSSGNLFWHDDTYDKFFVNDCKVELNEIQQIMSEYYKTK